MESVLCIDDDRNELNLLSQMIKVMNYQVIVSQTGQGGINMAETGNPDVILLDLMMPGMDGFQVIHELRKNPITRKIPIIIVSAKKNKEDILAAMQQGITDYVGQTV